MFLCGPGRGTAGATALKIMRNLDAYELVDYKQDWGTYGLHTLHCILGLKPNDFCDLVDLLDLEVCMEHPMNEIH